MGINRRMILAVFLVCMVVGVGLGAWDAIKRSGSGGLVTPFPPDMAGPVQELMAEMTVEEKVGQLMAIGIGGREFDEATRRILSQIRPGGITLFSRNISDSQQVTDLIQQLQRESDIPLFISVDQEGGRVSRLQFDGVVMPSQMAVGATRSPELSYEVGGAVGAHLRSLGINMNFAPVMDVNNNPRNPVIGDRSYGDTPSLVAELGTQYIRGLQSADVLAVAKHFPGHGDTTVDSHIGLPSVPFDRERLDTVELVPFKAAAETDIGGIMSAHIVFSALDSSRVPATVSRPILTGILREEWGYDGLIVTDDLEMKAVSERYGAMAGVKAVEAGADLILVCHTPSFQTQVYEQLLAAVREGRISQTRLNQSVERILRAKERVGLLAESGFSPGNEAQQKRTWHQVQAVAQKVADHSVTVAKDEAGLIPLQRGQRVLVISPRRNPPFDPSQLGSRLRQYSQQLGTQMTITPQVIDETVAISTLLGQAKACDVVVLVTNNAIGSRYQTQLYQSLRDAGVPLILVATGAPYDGNYLWGLKTFIAMYTPTAEAVDATARILLGEAPARGKLPVSLEFP